MRTTLPLTAAVVALAALLPSRAAAGGWQLRAGTEYAQSDTWTPDSRTRVPRLDVDLGLNAGSSIGGPGILDWGGDVQYRRAAVNGNDEVQNHVSYGLSSTLLGAGTGPLTVSGYARRSDQSFTTDGASAGSLLSNNYGGEFVLRSGGSRPWLRGSYANNRDDSNTLALGPTSRSLQSVNATSGFGGNAFSYSATYRGNFSDGTFSTDRFADHRVDADADTNIGRDTRLRLNSTYLLRTTPVLDAINAHQEATGFSATLLHTPEGGLQHSGTYAYNRAYQRTGVTDVERLAHRLNYSTGGQLPASEWSLRGGVGATYDEDRAGLVASRTASQSLSTLVTWRRVRPESQVDIHGGPTVGVLEPEHGDARLGYGVGVGVGHFRNGSVRTSYAYDLSMSSDVGSDQGWAFSQGASATADMRLGLSSLQGMLQLAADRRQSPLLGAAGSRSISGLGTWRLRTTEVTLQVGYQDGTSGRITSASGDGLFIAPAYDSRTAFAVLGASTSFGWLSAHTRVRYNSVNLPDRPAYGETQLYGAIDYAYGALRIGIEDSYVVTDVSGGQIRVNQFLVKAYRVFGSRF